jgi:tRNA(Ile)-lysidine synthase
LSAPPDEPDHPFAPTGRSTHPPSLRRLAERTIVEERLFSRGEVVLCACSGGPDSTALLSVLALLRKTLRHELVAHGVDHGLRPEAKDELARAAALAERLRVPFEVTQVELPPGGNLQARARQARYEALQRAASRHRAAVIATGHTADDRAETVLLRLLRGAGPRGLSVLAPRAASPFDDGAGAAVDLVRPLIRARRADVLAHLRRHEIAYADDPSNLDPRFTRVRVRREVVPLLEEISPRIIEHLCALADMIGELCPEDDPLGQLNRAQRAMVERAYRQGQRNVKIRVAGGKEVDVTFSEGKIVLNESR